MSIGRMRNDTARKVRKQAVNLGFQFLGQNAVGHYVYRSPGGASVVTGCTGGRALQNAVGQLRNALRKEART